MAKKSNKLNKNMREEILVGYFKEDKDAVTKAEEALMLKKRKEMDKKKKANKQEIPTGDENRILPTKVELAQEKGIAKKPSLTPEQKKLYTIYGTGGVIAFISFLLTLAGATGMNVGISATDWFLVAFAAGYGPFASIEAKKLDNASLIDDKFPDLLRDLAESARAGLTLPKALINASHGTYGLLNPEIKIMASQVEWGIDFSLVLKLFANRVKTRLITRTVALVTEAQRAGGNMIDILTAASEDAREIKQILDERNQQMQMYSVVILISYFVFLAVIMILATQFLPAFKEAVQSADGAQVGGLKFKDFEIEDFLTVFYHAAIVQSIGGGFVGSVLSKGNFIGGWKVTFAMIIAATATFRLIIPSMIGDGPPTEEELLDAATIVTNILR